MHPLALSDKAKMVLELIAIWGGINAQPLLSRLLKGVTLGGAISQNINDAATMAKEALTDPNCLWVKHAGVE